MAQVSLWWEAPGDIATSECLLPERLLSQGGAESCVTGAVTDHYATHGVQSADTTV